EMLVGSIVNTLTEFSEIKRVQLLVEGKKIESISGHLDLTKPVERMENLIK
ncbi:MAG: GerMN domain-containing protein, partial [Selenomonas sp.]|nr:GerMN domain-containing protein [Selenomonas sp.]